MRVYLSGDTYKNKPDKFEVGKLSKSILEGLVDINLQEFAEEVAVNGKTAVLAELKSKRLSKYTPIVKQELIMLDFDNKDPKNIYTIEDLEQDTFMLENACFIYRTFSDENSKVDKFRVVFYLENPIYTNSEVETIYQELFRKYPQADSSVGQTSRLFFGSNSGYEVIDWENTLNVENIHLELINSTNSDLEELITEDLPNYKLLKIGRFDIVKEKLGDNFSGNFPDPIVAGNYFKTIDMVELLELPDENPFLDIFHEEDNPSAGVYFNKEYDIYLYKCFSKSSEFQGDIIRVLRRLLNINSYTKIIEILINITNSEINWRSELGEARYNALELQKSLENNTLRLNYPELNKYLYNYRNEIIILLDLVFDYTYIDKATEEVRYMNFLSLKTYTKLVKERLGYKISEGKMWNILNVVTVTELLRKIETSKIPPDIFESLILKQNDDSEQIRTSNVYTPTIDVDNAQSIAKNLAENNVTISGLGYDLIYRLFGEIKANQDFPQAYKPLVNKGLVKMSSKDKNLTKSSLSFEKSMVKLLISEIEKNGYIFESELVSKLAKKRNVKQNVIQNNLRKIRADVYSKYGIERERLSKELYYELKIKGIYSTKVVLYIKN